MSFCRRIRESSFLRKSQRRAAALLVVAAILDPSAALAAEERDGGESPSASQAHPPVAISRNETSLPPNDPRRDLRITLVSDKQEYFLGENVVLHYRIENRGKSTFHLDCPDGKDDPLFIDLLRGDWDGARRSQSFKIEAIDQCGCKAREPLASRVCLGGGGSRGIFLPRPELKPGNQFCIDFPLMIYREPDGPGRYTIKVYRDLGWEPVAAAHEREDRESFDIPPRPHNAPVVTTTIAFRAPAPQHVRRIVEAVFKLPKEPDFPESLDLIRGKRGESCAEISLLRYPVYLPIARELAEKGDVRGVRIISSMDSPEAMQAILDLADHKAPTIACKAQEELLVRMPSSRSERRDRLTDHLWHPDLKSQAVQLGWRLLASEDHDTRVRGGWIIGSLGGREDLPRLIEAMNRLLPIYKDTDAEQRQGNSGTMSEALSDAAEKLIRRGASPPTAARTPGQAVAFLAGLESSTTFRPPGWQGVIALLMQHEVPFVRAQALQQAPLPLDDATAAIVASHFRDQYAPVQRSACELAGRSKIACFRQPLIDLVKTYSDDSVLQSAFEAARACGAEMDRLLEILVGRFEPAAARRNETLLVLMIMGTIEDADAVSNVYHSDWDWRSFLVPMQRAWRDFIAVHRHALRAGKRFPIAEPPLRPEMFPPGFQFTGVEPPWPRRPGKQVEPDPFSGPRRKRK